MNDRNRLSISDHLSKQVLFNPYHKFYPLRTKNFTDTIINSWNITPIKQKRIYCRWMCYLAEKKLISTKYEKIKGGFGLKKPMNISLRYSRSNKIKTFCRWCNIQIFLDSSNDRCCITLDGNRDCERYKINYHNQQ